MIKNRFYKSTLGVHAEILIARSLYAAGTPVPGASAIVDVPVTIAADPIPGDVINIDIDGAVFSHIVPGGDETTQQAHDAIYALLVSAGASFGFTVASHSGTTSSTYQLLWPSGTAGNGKVFTLTETGSTFTVAGPYTSAGGVDAVGNFGADYKAFVATSALGALAVFWDDTNLSVDPGETALPQNALRKIFYAVNMGANNVKRTTGVPVTATKIKQPYSVGAKDTYTVTGTGTAANGQRVYIRIYDKTRLVAPYDIYEYDALITGGNYTAAYTAIAAAINADKDAANLFVASSSTNVLTITAANTHVFIQVMTPPVDTPAGVTDAIVQTVARTVTGVEEMGTYADILELEQYQIIAEGGINYAPESMNVGEWQTWPSNVISGTNYGILTRGQVRTEKGETRNYDKKMYTMIALPTASLNALAAY